MSAGNLARVVAVLAACVVAAGSATSTSNSSQKPLAGPGSESSPPPPQDMEPSLALGLWRSTFGAVKIEPDDSKGGIDAGSVHGIWVYQRQGQEVIGYFAGNLRGNVLEFHWQEPSDPPLTGEGFLVFDVQGRQYAGRWWSERRDRVGDWSGWRQGAPAARPVDGASPYGVQSRDDLDGNPYLRSQPRRPAPPPQQPSTAQQTFF
ncbi:MAG TPA: hypothetical protein VHW23_48615 [Kofleriaceae bacterium]|jgi:hypothetical protein|nr:hypothetical protein [Kofleriaceae bacterium]